MTLATLQRALQAHITGHPSGIEPLVAPEAQRGLPVYVYAYAASLRAALRDTYEKTALWLGDEAFDAVADGYVREHPSRSWTLADYGAGLPALLDDHFPDDPEVAELAWLDWDLRHAFAASDGDRPDADALPGLDWEAARFTFAPHVAFRATRTNVAAIWNAIAQETPVEIELLDQPAGVLVWRAALSPQFRSCPGFELALLEKLRAGESFGQACASSDAGPDEIGAVLAQWLADGIISVIH